MAITQIKVFGERNTGTNWLEDLIMKNYDVPVIHHRDIINHKTTPFEKQFIDSLPPAKKKFVRESVNDAIFANKAASLFGWKHASITSEILEKHPKFTETGFILVVKHPYAFIKSLHKKPYHTLVDVPKSLDKFISTPWPTLQRDNIGAALLSSPIELWNYKVSSYVKFVARHKNALICRYESLLENYEVLFDMLGEQFSVMPTTKLPVDRSSKPDRLVTADYKKKYLEKDPSSSLSQKSIDLMKSTLDKALVEHCYYDL